MNFLNRNLYLLFACQTIFVSGSILLVTVGGIVGHAIAPDEGFATLPVALMVIGTAAATIPAAWMMQRKGRRFGFIFAAVLGAFGATLATYALHGEYFGLFCAATVPVGASLGFSQQFRFAAAESVQTHQVSHAVSFILLGSIAGAFLGPALVTHSADMNPDTPYSLAFSWLVGLYLLAVLLLRGLNFSEQSQANALRPKLVDSFVDGVQPSSMLTALRLLRLRPAFVTAVLAGVVGQGVMTYVMTATPVSMNVEHGFSIQMTSEVIRAHVIAMYLPSLIAPWLIARMGLPRMMMMGSIALAAALVIGLSGHQLMHFGVSLILLGIGWNFLFVSGTALLVQSYHPHESFRAQAFNDFSVFGVSAVMSLLAGVVLSQFGWLVLLISAMPAVGLMLVVLIWMHRTTPTGSV